MDGVTGGGLPAQIWRDFVVSGLDAGLVERLRPAPQPPPLEQTVEQGVEGIFHRAWDSLFGR
jgi:penicillin-binding protein 1A